MPDESPLSLGFCAFCDREATRETLLHESENFYVVADFAPVADAHILLIPRQHYAHLGSLPPSLDDEFHALKAQIGAFVRTNYGRLVYWENGVFGQSVPHAHLHSMAIEIDTQLIERFGAVCHDLPTLRSHHPHGDSHYFFIEHEGISRVLPPEAELYGRVIRHARERNGGNWRYGAMERRLHGRGLVEEMMQCWRREYGEPGANGHERH